MGISQQPSKGIWDKLWHAPRHKSVLLQILNKHGLYALHAGQQEVAFTLYNHATLEKERISCLLIGIATDRCALAHSGDMCTEGSISILMCFICGGKHLRHNGFDKCGRPCRKGDIDYRSGSASFGACEVNSYL